MLSKTLLEQIIENLPVAVASCDEYFKWCIWNKKAQELIGDKPEYMEDGMWLTEFNFTDMDGLPIKNADIGLYRAITEKKEILSKAIYKRPDRDIQLESHSFPLYDEQKKDKVVGGYSIFEDTTQRNNMEQLLAEIEQKINTLKEYVLKAL